MGGACVRPDDNLESRQETGIPRPVPKMLQSQQTSDKRPDTLTFSGYKSFKNIKNISQKYKIGKELGHGCFGSVYEAV